MQIINLTSEKPKWEKTPDGFLRCKCRVLMEKVMPYLKNELEGLPDGFAADKVQMYVPMAEMSDPEAIRSLEGAPIVAGDHTWLTPDLVSTYGMGSVAGTPKIEGPYMTCDLLVTNPDAISAIEAGELQEISAGYHAEPVFEEGSFNEQVYNAIQKKLRFNHIAVIPAGHGRAGADVRIINKSPKEEVIMAGNDVTPKLVRVMLKNTGKYVNVDEEGAAAIEEENKVSGANLEKSMDELATKNEELAGVQAEVDELKGELSVYKEKLDSLLSEEAIEHAAEGMLEESNEAKEIVENSLILNEKGEEDDKEKEKVMNSIKGVYGSKLHVVVLNAIGAKTEGLSTDALRGAFKAQHQISLRFKNKGAVAGTKIMNKGLDKTLETIQAKERSGHERLGFPKK